MCVVRGIGGLQIIQIKQIGDRIFARLLADRGINEFNGPQSRILYVLWNKDGISMSELSKETGLAQTTLSSMTDRLEKSGLVRRVTSKEDRRKILLYLTEKTRSMEEEYVDASQEMRSIMFKGFSQDEIDQFEDHLTMMLDNFKSWNV